MTGLCHARVNTVHADYHLLIQSGRILLDRIELTATRTVSIMTFSTFFFTFFLHPLLYHWSHVTSTVSCLQSTQLTWNQNDHISTNAVHCVSIQSELCLLFTHGLHLIHGINIMLANSHLSKSMAITSVYAGVFEKLHTRIQIICTYTLTWQATRTDGAGTPVTETCYTACCAHINDQLCESRKFSLFQRRSDGTCRGLFSSKVV